ncbi:protein of unknown function [Moritella yayanosii]|uniref:Uncharacterized protein n=1 Tax=Moritella yayanosii TaxID=69539 RepID=A0A330LL96_9GAMM|nr:protein of unknown function [Moritella yayanosii]
MILGYIGVTYADIGKDSVNLRNLITLFITIHQHK